MATGAEGASEDFVLVIARLISLLEIACEGAPAASAERGSCGELMELSSGLTTGMVIDARRTTHARSTVGAEVRKEACGRWWQATGGGSGACLTCIDSLTRGIDSGTRGDSLGNTMGLDEVATKSLTRNQKPKSLDSEN
jgi:hypothetical protein